MPIIVNLDVVLAQRKMRLNDLAAAVDITPQNLSILKTGKAKAIRFSTLEAICETLECQPGEILEFRPEPAKKKKINHGWTQINTDKSTDTNFTNLHEFKSTEADS
jgi:putative transcriptional regulator